MAPVYEFSHGEIIFKNPEIPDLFQISPTLFQKPTHGPKISKEALEI
jgi:hypothetical protein